MSLLQERLAKKSTVMYSASGATFQEWALSILDYKGSAAHKAIGAMVTAINNGQLTIGEAKMQYAALLSN